MILLGVIVGSTVAIVIYCRPVYFIPGKLKKKLKIRKLNYKLVWKESNSMILFIAGFVGGAVAVYAFRR